MDPPKKNPPFSPGTLDFLDKSAIDELPNISLSDPSSYTSTQRNLVAQVASLANVDDALQRASASINTNASRAAYGSEPSQGPPPAGPKDDQLQSDNKVPSNVASGLACSDNQRRKTARVDSPPTHGSRLSSSSSSEGGGSVHVAVIHPRSSTHEAYHPPWLVPLRADLSQQHSLLTSDAPRQSQAQPDTPANRKEPPKDPPNKKSPKSDDTSKKDESKH